MRSTAKNYPELIKRAKRLAVLAEDDNTLIKTLIIIADFLVYKSSFTQTELNRSEAFSAYETAIKLTEPNSELQWRAMKSILIVPDNLGYTTDSLVTAYCTLATHLRPRSPSEKKATTSFIRNVKMLKTRGQRLSAYTIAGYSALPNSNLAR